jgi:hypothetical protein
MSKGHGKKVVSVAAAMAFVATIMIELRAVPKRSNEANFDTDSTMIDNRGMACYSNNPAHFIGNLTPELKIRKRFQGSRTTIIMTATTIRWEWLDQDGLEHAVDIPDPLAYLNENVVCSTRNTGRKRTRKQQAGEPGKRPTAMATPPRRLIQRRLIQTRHPAEATCQRRVLWASLDGAATNGQARHPAKTTDQLLIPSERHRP